MSVSCVMFSGFVANGIRVKNRYESSIHGFHWVWGFGVHCLIWVGSTCLKLVR